MTTHPSVSCAPAATPSKEDQNVLGRLGIPGPKEAPDYSLRYEQTIRLKDHYQSMEPCRVSKASISRLAEELANQLRIDATTDFYALIKANGGRISYVQYDELKAEDGSIFIHTDRTFDVILPIYTAPTRDRFTLAHELGHYVLHSPRERSYALRRDSTPVEWEANWFAAGLLMPEKKFLQAMAETKDDMSLLAARFGVSRQAADVRLQSLTQSKAGA